LELRTVVGLDDLYPEGKAPERVVDELDRRLLVEAIVETEDAQTRAVVGRLR
jgi:hypothetical protein